MRRALITAIILLFARAAGAQPCLSEPATLDDQRALAALRSATETACPCASFSRRGAYQHCARVATNNAVLGGTLRQECLRTARGQARGAACGSSRVPCGRVRASDQRFDCRLGAATACTDTARYTRTACTAETHCADVVDWTAGTCFDVRSFGPYAPGYRSITYTKDSVVSPGTPRPLATSIWYPAPPDSAPIASNTGGVLDAPLDTSGGPYPLVLFSHGSCGTPVQSKFLTPLLASWGFVVVAPPHPGNTIAEFPNCNTPAAQVNSFLERPQDVVFVLNQVLAANLDSGSPLFGAIDPTRIGMSGHSFGGLTTYLVTAIEPRITAAVAMAPATLAGSTLPVPSLTMLGVLDAVISNPNARAAYDRSVTPKWLVEIEHAGHFAFSDFCLAASGCGAPGTLTTAEANAAALRYVLPFLKVYVEGDQAWAPLLQPPAQPGFVYASAR
jgi:predicted dienelactone hydrolase